jgi:hypothetical protein
MRTLIIKAGLVAGVAVSLAACNSGNKAANNSIVNEIDANVLLTAPGNDASAVESVTNTQPAAPAPPSNAAEPGPPPSSGNNVEANTVGM